MAIRPRFNTFADISAHLIARAQDGLMVPLYSVSSWAEDAIIGWMRYSSGLDASVAGFLDLTRVTAADEPGLDLVDEDGASAYTWASGLAITDATRISLGLMDNVVRAKLHDLTVVADFQSMTLGGVLDGDSRPRFLAGFMGALRVMACGAGYDGTQWEAANEFGAKAAPSLQSIVTITDPILGGRIQTLQQVTPIQAGTTSAYNVGVSDPAGMARCWGAGTEDATIIDYGATRAYISVWDSDPSTTPACVVKSIQFSFTPV